MAKKKQTEQPKAEAAPVVIASWKGFDSQLRCNGGGEPFQFEIGKVYELDGIHPTSRELVLEGWVDGEQFGYTVQRKWLAGVSAQRGY